MTAAALTTSGLTVRFGGTVAASGVDLAVPAGQVVGLVGPNGAGKSTCFNAVSGYVRPTSGSVQLFGEDVTGLAVHELWQRGLGRTFQNLELFWNLTVRDNLLVAARRRSRAEASRMTDEVLTLCGLGGVGDVLAARLPMGTGRLVEFARALCSGAQLLLLDEPSSGLDVRETESFGALVERANAEQGVTVVLVEHDMTMIERLCRYVYLLDFGRLVDEGPYEELRERETLRRVYLGEAVA